MIAKLLTLPEIKNTLNRWNFATLKYVRIGDEFSFVMGGLTDGPAHCDMLTKNESATSAGMCVLDGNTKEVHPIGESTTLQLKPAPDDGPRLTQLFFSN